MSPNDRFYGCEALGFPEVLNYDYESNASVRGVDNRQFRWQEVPVESIYLFKEGTSGGSFEENYFFSGLAYPTGVNIITSTGTNTTSYPGWTLSGTNTLHIGTSGNFFFSGCLTGISGSFQAHPIYGDHSIGLYAARGTNYPTLYSSRLATGSEGEIIPDNRHQVYLQGITNYGTTSNLQVYVRAYTGNIIVGYYDSLSGAWTAGVPTGSYTILNSGYTTVKYEFTTSNFPSSTPSSYDLVVSNVKSGSFATVDNIHIDAYLKKNAFIDDVLPTGYFVQMTPDLGWHDVLSMFNYSETLTNPHLKTLGPYQVELGNLLDNLDNSVTATVDSSDFLAATTNGFKKYLWRAVAISPNGQLGLGGLPQKFEYVGNALNAQFKVDKVIEDPTSTSKIILGKRSSRMIVLVDDQENFPGLEYPTTTSWKLTINMVTHSRTIKVQGKDSGGGRSSYQYITLTTKLFEQNEQALWNAFDEHGLVADVERLPDESNYEYSLRIKDSYRNKGGSSFVGIVNGASRELDLSKTSDAITISIKDNTYGTPLATSVDLEVTSYSLRVNTPSMRIVEVLPLDLIHKTIDLSYLPKETPEFTSVINGEKIDHSSVSIDDFSNDDSAKYRYKIDTDISEPTFVSVSYTYYKEFFFKQYPTLGDLVTAITSFTDSRSISCLQASLSSNLSGNEDCLGLFITSATITPTQDATLAWSPLYLKRISDLGYKNYFLVEGKTLKESTFYTYVKELKNNTKIFWGSVEADRSRWDAADSKDLGMDSIPTLFDPPVTHITSFITGVETRLEAVSAWGRNYVGLNNEYLSNIGLSVDLFHPGVAYKTDLKPDLYVLTTYTSGDSSLESNVGPVRNDNNILIFSGQR